MYKVVDKIAAKYDRYTIVSTVINLSSTWPTAKDLPDRVPKDFCGLQLLVSPSKPLQPSEGGMLS